MDYDVGAYAGEAEGHGSTYALGGAGYQGYAAMEGLFGFIS